jgi:hypothetical protein
MNIVIWTGHEAQGLQVVPSSGHMIKHGALLGKRQALGHALFYLQILRSTCMNTLV